MIVVRTIVLIAFLLFILSCDLRENALIRDQAETFEKELKYRQKQEVEISNKLQVSQEKVKKLELQLECRETLINEEVEEAKREALRENPIIIR